MDMVVSPVRDVTPSELNATAEELAPGSELRLRIEGEDDIGNPRSFVAVLPLGEGGTGAERLLNAGLETIEDEGKVIVDGVGFDSAAQDAGLDFDQVITSVLAPVDQPPKQLMYIPAMVVLVLIVLVQRRRRPVADAPVPASA
jgi:hypothetical protein